jgi:hypothetical protein
VTHPSHCRQGKRATGEEPAALFSSSISVRAEIVVLVMRTDAIKGGDISGG